MTIEGAYTYPISQPPSLNSFMPKYEPWFLEWTSICLSTSTQTSRPFVIVTVISSVQYRETFASLDGITNAKSSYLRGLPNSQKEQDIYPACHLSKWRQSQQGGGQVPDYTMEISSMKRGVFIRTQSTFAMTLQNRKVVIINRSGYDALVYPFLRHDLGSTTIRTLCGKSCADKEQGLDIWEAAILSTLIQTRLRRWTH